MWVNRAFDAGITGALECPAHVRPLVWKRPLVGNTAELSTAVTNQFLARESLDRNCLGARFYALNIDPRRLMHLLSLS